MENPDHVPDAEASLSLMDQAAKLALDVGKNVLHGAAVVVDHAVDVLNQKGEYGIDDGISRAAMTVLRFVPIVGTVIQGAEEIDRHRGDGRISHLTARLRGDNIEADKE